MAGRLGRDPGRTGAHPSPSSPVRSCLWRCPRRRPQSLLRRRTWFRSRTDSGRWCGWAVAQQPRTRGARACGPGRPRRRRGVPLIRTRVGAGFGPALRGAAVAAFEGVSRGRRPERRALPSLRPCCGARGWSRGGPGRTVEGSRAVPLEQGLISKSGSRPVGSNAAVPCRWNDGKQLIDLSPVYPQNSWADPVAAQSAVGDPSSDGAFTHADVVGRLTEADVGPGRPRARRMAHRDPLQGVQHVGQGRFATRWHLREGGLSTDHRLRSRGSTSSQDGA